MLTYHVIEQLDFSIDFENNSYVMQQNYIYKCDYDSVLFLMSKTERFVDQHECKKF